MKNKQLGRHRTIRSRGPGRKISAEPHIGQSERVEVPVDSIEESLWSRSDAMKLYRALFGMIPDALILSDANYQILAANSTAAALFSSAPDGLIGYDCRLLVATSFRTDLAVSLDALTDDAVLNVTSEAVDARGVPFPVELSVHKVSIAHDVFLQIVLRDIRTHVGLEQDLQRQEAVVEGMNLALRHVIRSVNEERKEMKDELVQQVKDHVLPSLERIAEEDCSDTRYSYKAVIEDQLVEMADGTSDPLDNIMLQLTPREMEICRLIALGRKSREICEMLHISFETMQTHRKNIRRKIGLKGQRISLYVYLQQQSSLSSPR